MKFIAYASCINRLILDEESTVGSQSCGVGFKFIFRKLQLEHFVKHLQHESSIAGTPTQSCSHGDEFLELYGDSWQFIGFCQQTIGTYHQIILWPTFNLYAVEFERTATGGTLRIDVHLQSVVYVDRIENTFEVMIAVIAAFYDV